MTRPTAARLKSAPPSSPGHPDVSAENAARAALESRAGRTLTDMEWAQARARLLEFATILRSWDQKAKSGNSRLDNVEVLCPRDR